MGTKISALPAASALGGTEVLPSVQAGGDVKVTANQLKTFVLSGLAAVASSGSAADLTTGTLAAARLPALSGDVTSSGGSAATTIANGAVSLTKMANVATGTVFYRKTAGSGSPEVQTLATLKTDLALTAADISRSVTTQAGTAYTLALADRETWIRFSNAAAVTLTVPDNGTVAFPIGTEITIEQAGAGALSVTVAGSAVVNSRGPDLTLAGQYAVATLKKVATNTWTLTGDL